MSSISASFVLTSRQFRTQFRILTFAMATKAFILAFCGLLALVSGQSTFPPPPVIDGPCPNYPPVATLDTAKLAGKWFVVFETRGGYGTFDPKASDKCSTGEYLPKPDGTFTYKFSIKDADNQPLTGEATTSLIGGKNVKQEIKVGNATSVLTFIAAEPNYMTYVVCESDGQSHRFTVEVASRQVELPPADLDKVKAALTAAKLPVDLHAIPHTGC